MWRLRHRAGRRGAIILTFATVYALFALQIHPAEPERAARLAYLYAIAPPQAWQMTWWLVAALAMSRVCSRNDALAFAALEGLGAVWAGGQYVALILHADTAAGAFAAIWTLAVILLRIIDGWAELPPGFVPSGDRP